MGNRPIIFVNTDNYPMFCDNRCANTGCSRHISRLYQHSGGAKISKLRDTEDCEGYISKRRQRKEKNVTDSDTKHKESEVMSYGSR